MSVARWVMLLGTIIGSAQVVQQPAPLTWIREGAPTIQAATTILALTRASQRGLELTHYQAADLARTAKRILDDTRAGRPWPQDSLAVFDSILSVQAGRFASDLYIGRVNPRRAKFEFVVDGKREALSGIVDRIAQSADVNALLDSLEPPYMHYRVLKAALQRFRDSTTDSLREQHVRKIELTMERWRWLPRQLGDRFIVVNVPAFQLYAFDLRDGNNHPKLTMPVVVGKAARHPTNIFSGTMKHLVFRPYWNIPMSILRNETLPKLRRNPNALSTDRLEIVATNAPDGKAQTYAATPANLSRLASGALRARQRPGPSNALGRVKFMFPNPHNIYLHDTPQQKLFAEERRDFSHGCIRVADPPALARFVLQDDPRWTPEAIDSAMNSGPESRYVYLEEPINVYVLYGTVLVDLSEQVHFYRDIYKLDTVLERELKATQ